MAATDMKNKKLKEFLLRTLADPVLLYTVIVMMSIMHHYREPLTLAYGTASLVIGWLVFRFFDYMQKHHITGFFGYIVIFSGFSWLTDRCIDKGQKNYPISWGLWFLTPQDSLEYNEWYTLAIYLLFLIFMLSVIYYFTRVRYRILMNFMIFIIPFAIYGKEYEKMPTRFIILMAVGYILLMVNFRQLSNNDKITVIDKPEAWKSIAVYTVIFALIAAIIPKPYIEADRTVLETLINADALTDRLVEMLNVFRDTAGGEQFRGNTSTTPIYYSDSKEPLRLKTATFTDYHFNDDTWTISSLDKSFENEYISAPIDITGNGSIAEAVLLAARLDSRFADKYGINPDTELSVPEEQTVRIFTAGQGGQFAPVPQFARELTETNYADRIAFIPSGLLFSDGGRFGTNTNFTFSYTPDVFFYDETNKAFVNSLGRDDYSALISDAKTILENAASAPNYADVWIIPEYLSELRQTDYYYNTYLATLLDYGESDKIYDLAQQITEDCVSDYEKAKALEMYFYLNGYTYDLGYQKTRGDNAETFMFDSKTGVCYEYATSMTLLARAAGIPARYCEGFNMQQEYESNNWKGYVVTSQDAHGFPELYIRGYGWMSFEPTLTDMVLDSSTASNSLKRAGFVILAFSLTALLLAAIWSEISHKLFLARNRKRSPDEAVKAFMKRICRIYGISSSNTSQEAARTVNEISGADVSYSALLFDRTVYGGDTPDDESRQKAADEYIAAYEALKETKKQSRKKRVNKYK